MQKVRIYTDTMEIVNKEEKITKAQSKIDLEIDDKKKLKLINTLEKLKLTPAKEGKIEDKYMDLHTPLKKFVVQKDIFPTMNLDLDKIIVKSLANFDVLYGSTFPIISLKGEYGSQSWKLMKGEMLQKLEVMVLSPEATAKASGKKDSLYFDFAIAGYVMDAKEFDYAKGTKKALKIVIDSSGYVSEKVIWPNREGVLEYPNTLKKGAVGIFMYSKKAESDYTSLRKVYIEKILKDGIINT
jgi:hypothetical protein